MSLRKIISDLDRLGFKAIAIIVSTIIVFYFWDFGSKDNLNNDTPAFFGNLDTRYFTLIPILFFLNKKFIITKNIFPILVINLYIVFQYILNFFVFGRVFNLDDLKYFVAFSLTTLMVFFCKEIILLHKEKVVKFLFYLAPLFLINLDIRPWSESELVWQCSIFYNNSYFFHFFFYEYSHFAMVALPVFLLNLFYLCKKFNYINFLFLIIFFGIMTIFLSTTMVIATILSLVIILITNIKKVDKKFFLGGTIILVAYSLIFSNIYGCSRKVSDLIYHNYILALQDMAIYEIEEKKVVNDIQENIVIDVQEKKVVNDIQENIVNDIQENIVIDVQEKKVANDVQEKKSTLVDIPDKGLIATNYEEVSTSIKKKFTESFISFYEYSLKERKTKMKEAEVLELSGLSENFVELDSLQREQVFLKINVSTQVAQNSFAVAIKTLMIKPLGVGLNRFEDAFRDQIESQQKNYSPEVMKINLNDGASNLNKLLGEFGIAFFVMCIYLTIFILSKKISIENKLFLFPLVLAQMLRGAGYFNGGFLVAMVLIVLIVHDTRKKN